MKVKKKSRGKLVLTLCLLLVTILFSVGGLTIINGVSAGSDNNVEIEQDEITVNELINSSYNSGAPSTTNKVPVKITSVDECIDVINNFLQNKAYVATSKGKMIAKGTNISGSLSFVGELVCDLPYLDWFEHETSGRAYWEEGFKMGKIYNSFVENMFNTFVDKKQISQLSRYYYIDDDVFFKQHAMGVNFKNNFELSPDVWKSIPVKKESNKSILKAVGYMSRYFRWDINKDTVQNAQFTKKLSGYQLDFDLDATAGARDVYKRIITYLPSSLIPRYKPAGYHYTIMLDKYGNINSFIRNETIYMYVDVPTASADVYLNFSFNYDFKVKDDDFKIELNDQLKAAVIKAKYEI